MLHVSIIVELLRSRPALAVWVAASAQALLWALIPTWFFASPPGDVPAVLAIGHEFQLASYLAPPLAPWLAEIAFDLTGHSAFGIYLLSQICVVVTYWAVFRLASAIVGAQQASLAVLLMVGIATFTVPTPDFGPVILTAPLWAVALLHYWLVVGEGRLGYRIALAVEVGLILVTTFAGLLLAGLMVLFTVLNPRARGTLRSSELWPAAIVAGVVLVPHVYWLASAADGLLPVLARLRTPASILGNLAAWLRQVGLILGVHAGLIVLVGLMVGLPWTEQEPAPLIRRRPIDPFARQFVYFFAGLPILLASFLGVILGLSGPVGGVAPLVVLSGLAVVLAAGDAIALTHQRIVLGAWVGLLVAPPVLVVIAVLTLPWIGIDLSVNQPAYPMGRFFADSFQRRVGTPLPIVTGDPRTAALIGLGAPARPSLFLAATPAHSPRVSLNDVQVKGAIVVWPTTDTAGTPPPEIAQYFPDLVPEVPRAFERGVQGQLGLLRIGWAMIRPRSTRDAPAAVTMPR